MAVVSSAYQIIHATLDLCQPSASLASLVTYGASGWLVEGRYISSRGLTDAQTSEFFRARWTFEMTEVFQSFRY